MKMRKLLLFTFTVALLSMLSVNSFAQWGKTVKVSTDQELVEALNNLDVEIILLKAGSYESLTAEVISNGKIVKSEYLGDRAECTNYFIFTGETCFPGQVITSVGTVPGDCLPEDSGFWYTTPPGYPGIDPDITFGSLTFYTNFVTAANPGQYTLGYYWPAVDRFVEGDYVWYDLQIDPMPDDSICGLTYEFEPDFTAFPVAPGETIETWTLISPVPVESLVFSGIGGGGSSGDPGPPDYDFVAANDANYRVALTDTWGDGWLASGGLYHTLTVEVNGVVVLDNITIVTPWPSGTGPESHYFTANAGDLVEITFTDNGSWAGECNYDLYQSDILATFDGNEVTVLECGEYTFQYQVQNGPCLKVTEVTINFYDTPEIFIQEDDEVCGLEYNLEVGYEVECEHPDLTAVWLPVAGATFDGNSVTVDACGEYEFTYEVWNGFDECMAVSSVTIIFYDTPVIDMQDDGEICGLVYDLDVSFDVDCPCPELDYGWFLYSGPVEATADFDGDEVTVSECGEYVFGFYVDNCFEDCSAVEYVTINFYDIPEVDAGPDDEVCGLVYELMPSIEVSCDYPAEGVWLPVAGATFDGNTVTVDACGEYEFIYSVTNGPCGPVTDLVVIDFYDEPVVDAGLDQEVCGLETDLLATVTVECVHDDYTGYWGVKSPAPGGVEFDNPAGPATGVTVTACGEYTFVYTVENGPCGPVTDFVIVNFYDEPEVIAYHADEVCGFETEVEICLDVECLHPDGITGEDWYVVNEFGVDVTDSVNIMMPVPAAVVDCPVFLIDVPECGIYTFTYSLMNGPCPGATTFTITFYETPEPEIFGPDEVNICKESDYYLIENSDCYLVDADAVTYTWSIDPIWAGDFKDGINTGLAVTILWNVTGPATIRVDAYIGELEDCTGYDEFEVDVVAPMLAGQVKYWNQFETYMPTPFPTQDYATYPHDYFYVTLNWGYYDGDVFIPALMDIDTEKVEPRLMEDLVELMSYFEFELEMYADQLMQYDGNLCEGWFLRIWDGGLNYYDMEGGYGLNPPQAARHLGNNYTYNNWGGVNATDALAIQLMAVSTEINGNPYNYNWVGFDAWSPRYGYYSHSAADVNSSNPYLLQATPGITALDALTANYRAVGLLDVFPNSQPATQYSPNFRVTGRMVPELPWMTWDKPFDYELANDQPVPFGTNTFDNPDDVPFVHSNMSYLYFHPAWEHKYTSAPIALTDKNYINIYYLALGDLNSSYVPTSTGFKAEPAMALNYDGEQVVNKGDVVTVPIRIDQNAELGAISLDLSYNTSLIEVLGIEINVENRENVGFSIDEEVGKLKLGWFDLTAPANFAFGDAIANIQVRVIGDISADTRFFELEANTELADRNAQPFKNINLETTALSSVSEGLFMTNYPNPFRETTMISYNIPEAGNVSLVVYNKLGQVVETLVSTRQDAGTYQVEFSRTDLTPGAYFYRIIVEGEANTYTSTNSMIFMQ
jgi:hypothetical protein